MNITIKNEDGIITVKNNENLDKTTFTFGNELFVLLFIAKQVFEENSFIGLIQQLICNSRREFTDNEIKLLFDNLDEDKIINMISG